MGGRIWLIAGASVLLASGCSGGGSAAANKAGAVVSDDKAAFAAGGGADGLTLAEYGAVSRAMRDGLDADSNGELSEAELAVLPDQRRGAWKMYDIDRNGTMTTAEYEGSVAPRFTMRDKNGDGKIMTDEVPDGTPAGGLLF